MIEHSITKYVNLPAVIKQAYTPMPSPLFQGVSTKYNWHFSKCFEYLADLRMRGFTVGAKVTTKYGQDAVIRGYKDIPQTGIDFFAQKYPNIILLTRATSGNNDIAYHEEELFLHINENQEEAS